MAKQIHLSWTDRLAKKTRKQQKKIGKKRYRLAGMFIGGNLRHKTPAETRLYDALMKEGIVFKFQKDIHGEDIFKIADFYFMRGLMTPLIVEVDGDYHNKPEMIESDIERTEFIKRVTGGEVIRFTNEQILNGDISEIINLIKEKHILIQYQT